MAFILLAEAFRMTLVAAWLDWTDQRSPRLLCQSDSRLSNTATKGTITDRTSKLFRLPLNLHRLSEQDFAAGGLQSPYFSSSVGFGYSGDTILALDVINILSQTLTNLIRQDEEKVLLGWSEIVRHAAIVIEGVVKGYSAIVKMQTDIMIFGARPGETGFQKLGAQHFEIKPAGQINGAEIDLYNDKCFAIGSAAQQFMTEATLPPALVQGYRDAKKLYERTTADQHDEREVALWLSRKDISEHYKNAFSSVVNSANATVGGSIQMIETTPSFMAARKRERGDLFDVPGIEQIGDFNVVVVIEP